MQTELSSEQLIKVIFDYVGKIAHERDLDTILMLMADMGKDMIQADRCTVWLIDEEKDELWSKVAHGVDELRIPRTSGLVGLAISRGEPIIIDDAYTNEPYRETLESGALALDQITNYKTHSIIVIPIQSSEGTTIGAFQAINKMTEEGVFSQQDLTVLELAASYSGKSLETAMLTQEIEAAQRDLIFTLGEVGEFRSRETGNHVRRVAEYSYILAKAIGMSQTEAELLKIASPMHDIGKIAIPDRILQKPGKLTDEEFEIMKSHTTIGHSLLKNSKRKLLQAAAIVAQQHHEKWNGKGYPNNLYQEEIHIYGRITAIADVFDALGSDRIYKKAWELERILHLFNEEKGQHFDPKIVDAFMSHLPELLNARDRFSDTITEEF